VPIWAEQRLDKAASVETPRSRATYRYHTLRRSSARVARVSRPRSEH